MRRGARLIAEDDPDWLAFWSAYPKRQSKKDARAAWADLEPDVELVARILAALAWQVKAYRWDSDKYDYCPLPASWLRAERWTDELPPPLDPQKVASRRPAWAQEPTK